MYRSGIKLSPPFHGCIGSIFQGTEVMLDAGVVGMPSSLIASSNFFVKFSV
jgi:hypothetical protein